MQEAGPGSAEAGSLPVASRLECGRSGSGERGGGVQRAAFLITGAGLLRISCKTAEDSEIPETALERRDRTGQTATSITPARGVD